jgi:Mg2+ and Co2+ transporter CorA
VEIASMVRSSSPSSALIVHLLGELADAEFLVVEQFEADRAALGQALLREAQTHFMHLVGRHHDRAAAFGQLVRNIGLLQRSHDRTAIAI